MNDIKLEQRLELLLSESLDSVRARQVNALGDLIGGLDKPFVLFGASHLGKKVLSVLTQMGYLPCAFIDNNSVLWGTKINGVPVYSPQELANKYQDQMPSVICTIWSGHVTDRMSERLAPLRKAGFQRVALFGHLAWRYSKEFLPHYSLDLPEKLLGQAVSIRQAFSLLVDEESRQIYLDHLEWRLTLNYDLLPLASSKKIYFDKDFSSKLKDEIVYDIGAFDGDTVIDYIESNRGYRSIHCFEPSPKNHQKIKNNLKGLCEGSEASVFIYPMAVGDSVGAIAIEDDYGAANRVGHGNHRVEVTTIDEMTKKTGPATFIKIDIEGFEPQCLAGGRLLIEKYHPVIAVSAYHVQDHLWSLLLQLHEYYPNYHYRLCPHLAEGWDLVLYAVPPERIPVV